MSGDALSMFWLTILFFIVVPGILYWVCCGELAPDNNQGAENIDKN